MPKKLVKRIRVNVSGDKRSNTTRTDRAKVVAANGPNSSLWQSTPQIQAAGSALINAGAELEAAEVDVSSQESKLSTARNIRASKQLAYDTAHAVYVATVEHHSTTPAEALALGVELQGEYVYPLEAPIEIEVRFDPVTGQIHIHVKKVPGVRSFFVEISPNPVGPGTWIRLRGVGAVHALSGYAPGMYWVRAASARAGEQSEFCSPVAVIVK